MPKRNPDDKKETATRNELLTMDMLFSTLNLVYEDRSESFKPQMEGIFTDVVKACKRHQKKGKILLTFTIDPADPKRMLVGAEVAVKKPEGTAIRATVFLDSAGRMLVDDPDQMPLPMVLEMNQDEE